ncbi:S66 peptidase family protein [Chelativorans xinjiangense]|uniref:S66 peptidase family protein n=1 Tax=Chelativorans xinjiangense TaxID=2681485 RepID=UPI001FEC228C|nr:LD-carboxypeptidase [Chelativorans xinjiangense]
MIAVMPPRLKPGDTVRFVSPASTPEKDQILRRAELLESWGLKVGFGAHAFSSFARFAGTDEERLADLNDALRAPEVRGIIATRGGKGSYRIADRLDFDAVRRDPKLLVGFSDITILHLMLWKQCGLIGVHGAVTLWEPCRAFMQNILMGSDDIVIQSRAEEPTSALTTEGRARGRLIGGNLDMLATAAGWALPSLKGAILLVEAVNSRLGQVDRQLTMLRKAGHLEGLAGVAVGRFTGFELTGEFTIIDLLREHLGQLDVPILGGLPLGHDKEPLATLVGAWAFLDVAAGKLTAARSTTNSH